MSMDNTKKDNSENVSTNIQNRLQQRSPPFRSPRNGPSHRMPNSNRNSNTMSFDGSTYFQNKINSNPALQSLLLDLVTLKNEYDQIDYGSVDEEVNRMRAAHDLPPLNLLKRRSDVFDDDLTTSSDDSNKTSDNSTPQGSPTSDDSNQQIYLDIPEITLDEIRRQQEMFEKSRSDSSRASTSNSEEIITVSTSDESSLTICDVKDYKQCNKKYCYFIGGQEDLQQHTSDHMSKKYFCSDCYCRFASKSELKIHVELTDHFNDKPRRKNKKLKTSVKIVEIVDD